MLSWIESEPEGSNWDPGFDLKTNLNKFRITRLWSLRQISRNLSKTFGKSLPDLPLSASGTNPDAHDWKVWWQSCRIVAAFGGGSIRGPLVEHFITTTTLLLIFSFKKQALSSINKSVEFYNTSHRWDCLMIAWPFYRCHWSRNKHQLTVVFKNAFESLQEM